MCWGVKGRTLVSTASRLACSMRNGPILPAELTQTSLGLTERLFHFHCAFPDPKVNSWFMVGLVLIRDYQLVIIPRTVSQP